MNKKTISDINVSGKKVLLRCDFNVPIKDGKITDDTRITAAIPTVKYLLNSGAKVILCSHLGRPKGTFDLKYTLKPVAACLAEILKTDVIFCSDVVGQDAKAKTAALKAGQVVLLENLRFEAGEEKNDKEFAQKLADLADIYVNDAFGTAHRAHASTAGVVQYGFIKTAAAGFLMEKEIKFLSMALSNPKRPFTAILGGAKVSDKIGVIKNLLTKADALVIGGGMAFTFLAAQGYDVGSSLVEQDKKELALSLLDEAKAKGVKLLLPVDVKTAAHFPDPIDAPIDFKEVKISAIQKGTMGLDIGTETISLFTAEIKKAATVLWNGPMGVMENPNFMGGTKAIAEAVAASGSISIIGGGDSVAAINKVGLEDKITHISTGGGASLEFLEGIVLPGIDALNNK